jgi:hypothetical protein
MLGFKRFETAAVTIRGIELAEKIKKNQFNLETLTGKPTTAPALIIDFPAAHKVSFHAVRDSPHAEVLKKAALPYSGVRLVCEGEPSDL